MSTQTLHPLQMATDALAALAAAEVLRARALRALEAAAGDRIHELTVLQAAYFRAAEHDDDLWARVAIAESLLNPIAAAVDALQR